MIRLLKALRKTSNPIRTASSWLSMVAIAATVSVVPPMTMLAGPVESSASNLKASQSQRGAALWSPIDGIVKMFAAEGHGTGDQKLADRAGKHVALQAGHWQHSEAPYPLNLQTGTSGGGKTEPEVTLDIAQRAAKVLEDMGYTVDILPTSFPEGYTADVAVAIHADGTTSPDARGFFADRYGDSAMPDTDDQLVSLLDDEYGKATGLPFKNRSTPGSHYYYGYRLIDSKTPKALIETGFLTNEQDREIIVKASDKAAQGIASAIDKFLVP